MSTVPSQPDIFTVGPGGERQDLGFRPLIDWVNENCRGIHIVAPQSKTLACGDVGMGALANVETIVQAVIDAVEKQPTAT